MAAQSRNNKNDSVGEEVPRQQQQTALWTSTTNRSPTTKRGSLFWNQKLTQASMSMYRCHSPRPQSPSRAMADRKGRMDHLDSNGRPFSPSSSRGTVGTPQPCRLAQSLTTAASFAQIHAGGPCRDTPWPSTGFCSSPSIPGLVVRSHGCIEQSLWIPRASFFHRIQRSTTNNHKYYTRRIKQ